MGEKSLHGKRVIVFYPDFFGYGETIAHAMQRMGMKTALYNSKSVRSAWGRALFKLFPEVVLKSSNQYFRAIYRKYQNVKIDFMLVIERLPIWFLKEMKRTHPQMQLILYMDDSIKNLKTIERRFSLFDRILSFDQQDAKQHEKILFRPLFYSVKEQRCSVQYPYDVCFIGTCHSDRYRIVKRISEQCERGRFYGYLYLQSRFMYYFYKIVNKDYRNAKQSEFSFQKMEYQKNIQIENASKVILDIQHPGQSGLTMRTIEMIGLKKKIITTNRDIVHYDFYRPANIQVIDRKDPVIDLQFFQVPYEELPDEVYKKYEINQWIKDVLGKR